MMSSGVSHLVRETLLWACVIGAGFAGVFYFDDIRSATRSAGERVAAAYSKPEPPLQQAQDTSSGFERSVTLQADHSGHFGVEARINGRPIALMVDTGATRVALTYEDARDLGFNDATLRFTGRTQTANGVARVAPVILDRIDIGSITVYDVEAAVAEPGRLPYNLLGMSFIRKLGGFKLRGRELELIQ